MPIFVAVRRIYRPPESGIFPTLSQNGAISHSASTGFEVSNSEDILLAHDTATGNTVGAAVLSFVPSGTGVLYLGVDESTISGNLVENNFFGTFVSLFTEAPPSCP
jgi:hypothetical protein